jgi:hypothetical protein
MTIMSVLRALKKESKCGNNFLRVNFVSFILVVNCTIFGYVLPSLAACMYTKFYACANVISLHAFDLLLKKKLNFLIIKTHADTIGYVRV